MSEVEVGGGLREYHHSKRDNDSKIVGNLLSTW